MTRLSVIAVAALGVAVLAGLIAFAIRRDGARDALQQVERQNTGAGNAADDDRSRFDRCPVGLWDFGTGQCRGPATRGGN